MKEIKRFSTIVKVCPSDKNYYNTNGWIEYDYLNRGKNVKWCDVAPIVTVELHYDDWDYVTVSMHFSSNIAYKRCRKLYEQWYYEKTPVQKEYGF